MISTRGVNLVCDLSSAMRSGFVRVIMQLAPCELCTPRHHYLKLHYSPSVSMACSNALASRCSALNNLCCGAFQAM